MIKIIKGTYGYRKGNRIIPKTPADDPFTATPEQEARLVRLGVAVYVDAPAKAPATPATPAAPKAPENAKTGSKDVDELPAYNLDMKLDELKEIAKAYGVDASDARKKADVIAMIEAAKAETQEENDQDDEDPENEIPEAYDDGEEPPSLDAADPV
ncbi:MAG TPA: transposase [Clostridiales bacterium]|jgi:hypothetical protein|nr:transposase [Clostridiales bacterium]